MVTTRLDVVLFTNIYIILLYELPWNESKEGNTLKARRQRQLATAKQEFKEMSNGI